MDRDLRDIDPPARLKSAPVEAMASGEAAPPREPSTPGDMGLLDHLNELRTVLVQALLAWAVTSAAGWAFSERVIESLVSAIAVSGKPLVFFGPADAFVLRMKVALGLGLFVAAPFIVWRFWAFIVPGLLHRERAALLPSVASSLVLFYSGAAFAYFVILPLSMRFLLGFGTASLQPLISGEKYFDFLLRVTLSFGAVFQFPLIATLLTAWGLLPPDFLRRHWRVGVVSVFVVAAVFTPPDVASQMLMAGPLLVLYVISIVLCAAVGKRRAAAQTVVLVLVVGAGTLTSISEAKSAPSRPDLAIRRDGFELQSGRVTVEVENRGDAPSPATTVELWNQPPLGGPSGTSCPYPAVPGDEGVFVFQEPSGKGGVRLTLVVPESPRVKRTRGSLTLLRGEGWRMEKRVVGVTLARDQRSLTWDAAVPSGGFTLPLLLKATRGAPGRVELKLPQGSGGLRVPLIRTSEGDINAFVTQLAIDALDRPNARRTRIPCPALSPGERASLHATFEGGARSEVIAWVDPNDAIVEAREGNNVSSIAEDASTWTQAALHLHSSFSEGSGSVDWQVAMAARSGYDLLFWSEHDWRMACADHVREVGFEPGERVEIVGGNEAGGRAEIIPQGGRVGGALRLAGERGRKSFASGELDADQRRLTYSLASDVGCSFLMRAEGLGSNDRVRVVFDLSHHPTERRRLSFDLTPELRGGGKGKRKSPFRSAGEARAQEARADTSAAAGANPSSSWIEKHIDLSAVARELWVNGEDDNISAVRFELETAEGAQCFFDELKVTHGECGAALRRIQESWMKDYPNIVHEFGDEVSFQRPHLNQYGGTRGLFDSARGGEALQPETVVREVHSTGGLVSYCHPFGIRSMPGTRERFDVAHRDSIIGAAFGGSDILEVGFREKASETTRGYLQFWDSALARGVVTTGIGVNDSHVSEWGASENNFATWIPAAAEDRLALLAALDEGRVVFGDPLRFRGRLLLESDGKRPGDRISRAGSRDVRIRITEAPPHSEVKLFVDGAEFRTWKEIEGAREVTASLGPGEGRVVRAELWSLGEDPLAFTNPLVADPTDP